MGSKSVIAAVWNQLTKQINEMPQLNKTLEPFIDVLAEYNNNKNIKRKKQLTYEAFTMTRQFSSESEFTIWAQTTIDIRRLLFFHSIISTDVGEWNVWKGRELT